MSSKLIFQLRKEGKKEQAWNLARKAYQDDPYDDWVCRAYAWTLVDMSKKMVDEGKTAVASEHFQMLEKLCSKLRDDVLIKQVAYLKPKVQKEFQEIHAIEQLSKNGQQKLAFAKMEALEQEGKLDPAHHEAYGWIIYRYVKEYADTDDVIEVKRKLSSYLKLKNERPSLLHSLILKFAIRFSKSHQDFNLLSFFKIWGNNNFMSEDLSSSYHEGKSVPSLLSKLAHQLIEGRYGNHLQTIQNVYNGQGGDLFSSLSIEEFTDVFRQTFFWRIYHLSQEKNKNELWQAFDEYLEELSDDTPTEWHSKVLSLAERLMDESNDWRFTKFFQAWNPSNLREEDWEKEVKDDNEYPALASKVFKRMYKIASESDKDFSWMLPVFQDAVEKNADDIWLRREYALLLVKYAKYEEAIIQYKFILKGLHDQYYVWSELAYCFDSTDPDMAACFYAKALSLQKKEDFLGEIRLKLGAYFISKDMLEPAKYQLDQYKKNREKNGWKIDDSYTNIAKSSWYGEVEPKNDKRLINKFTSNAEDFVFNHLPWHTAMVAEAFSNKTGKEMLVLVLPDQQSITVKRSTSIQLNSLKQGDPILVRIINKEGKLTALQFSLPDQKKDVRHFPLGYAYVDGLSETKAFLVSPDELKLVINRVPGLKVGQFLSGTILRYRKKREDLLENFATMINIKAVDSSLAIKAFKTLLAIIDHVNEQKMICHFETGKGLDGLISFDQVKFKAKEGDIVEIVGFTKTNSKNQKTHFNIISVSKTDKQAPHLKKNIKGNLELKYKRENSILELSDLDYEDCAVSKPDFGFVQVSKHESYYIPKHLLGSVNYNCKVEAEVMYSRKGWKVLSFKN